MPSNTHPLTVAYFTMEIGLQKEIPTYAGGLGMLAADLMRSCADMKVAAACVSMCWQHGYMHQTIKPDGSQQYEEMNWDPAQFCTKLPTTITLTICGHQITVGCWKKELVSQSQSMVPVFLLDTNLAENSAEDREITNHLYGGDGWMRLKQETVLGIGGVKMLRALGYTDIGTFHMNEGHAAFLTLELLRERNFNDDDVRKSCAFTTHTPVPAGHDVFSYDVAHTVLGDNLPWHIKKIAGDDGLSMTLLAMNLSRYTCGVSRVHGMVSGKMFPGHTIDYITNGVHLPTWISSEMKSLFDKHCSGWQEDREILRKQCRNIPDDELRAAHMAGKKKLIEEVNKYAIVPFDTETLTIASARRVVSYKRPELLYTNLERLKDIGGGKLQIIHSGNAHPADPFGQEVIQRMIQRSKELKDCMRIAYLPNYNPELAKLLVAGADVWLNTPMRLHEASGTSGMKACINGTMNLSTLDGWWSEAYEMDPEAGWRIGPLASALNADDTRAIDAEDLYTQLQFEVIPEFEYIDHVRWARRMKRAIGLMSYFSSDRCIEEYVKKAWTKI